MKLSRLLGHHSPAITLGVYSHLLHEGAGAPLDLEDELGGGNTVATSAALPAAGDPGPLATDLAW